ncbi:MAG: hypothetical protein KIT34_02870 [Cyanobacteria bacterium TGS_CYA1]|nr:hypothetical protein [Cyanobacteria bacterium TGS_CYA1]
MRLILALAMTLGINCFPLVTSACDMHKSSSSSNTGIESLKGLSPGDAYTKYHAVLEHAKDVSELFPYWTLEATKDFEAKNMSKDRSLQELDNFKKLVPETLKVVSEKIEGENAMVIVESHEVTEADKEKLKELESLAKASDSSVKLDQKRVYKSNIKGDIAMRLENGIWKVHRENIKSEFESDPADEKSDAKANSKSKSKKS